MQVVGIIKRIDPLKQISETFKSQDLILITDEQYSQTLAIQFTQEKIDFLNIFEPGQKVKIDINLRGREVIKEGKPPMVFNSITAWKIEKAI